MNIDLTADSEREPPTQRQLASAGASPSDAPTQVLDRPIGKLSEEIDSTEAESIPPSGPSSSSDDRPTFSRLDAPPVVGVMPPVTERPVPIEPKVVITKRPDSDAPTVVDPNALPLPARAPIGTKMSATVRMVRPEVTARPKLDTPAAAPVMAPAPVAAGPSTAETVDDDALKDMASAPGKRRARTIAAVLAAACLAIGAIAGVRIWQKGQTAAASPAEAKVPSPAPLVDTPTAASQAPPTPAVTPNPTPTPAPTAAETPPPPAAPAAVPVEPAARAEPPAPIIEPQQERSAERPSERVSDDSQPADPGSRTRATPPSRTPKPASPTDSPPAGPTTAPRSKFDPKRI
jgi:hypothetical protein